MKHTATLLAVHDMQRALSFYRTILGLEIIADFGANVTLTGGIALQTLDSWKSFLSTDEITFSHNAGELYFEEDDFDHFARTLESHPEIRYVHPLMEHAWGQRVVRFYDPDGHMLEVGESLPSVVRRFLSSGLSPEQTALRMDVPLEYIQACQNGSC